ncbi:MAG: DUF1559 domain-containing protein [Planctomycetes bacterium]|nr:DUF1559 domain-containing protein [Planctomycetota bacterium]
MQWRPGFTLVELLVVIAIIGVLVALLLPAVQAAREAARRMQCTNNLKQLALGCHNYHDTYKTFPPNHLFSRPPGQAREAEGWGWQALILPFIEQQPLHETLGVTKYTLMDVLAGNNPQAPTPLVPFLQETVIETFICPSDANSTRPTAPQARHFGGGQGTRAGGWGRWRPPANNYMSSRGTRNNWPNVNNLDAHGMFSGQLGHRLRDVTDGTSNTFFIGERETQYCRGGTWIGVRNPQGNRVRGFYYNTANVRVPLNAPDPPFTWNTRSGCSEGFASLHPGGANFAFADGAVRFISETIDTHFNQNCCAAVPGGTGCCYHGIGQGPGGAANKFSPGKPGWEPVFRVYQRLGRRNDGFPATIP